MLDDDRRIVLRNERRMRSSHRFLRPNRSADSDGRRGRDSDEDPTVESSRRPLGGVVLRHCHVSPNLARGRAQVLERLFGSAPTGRRDSGPNIADSPLQKETRVNLNRRNFFAGSLTIAAASGVARAQSAVPGGTHGVERQADFDATRFAELVGRPAQIRQLYEAVSFQPGVLGSVKNSFNGLQFGFGYRAEAIAIVLAGHGPSAGYGYSDYIWRRYRIGEFSKIADLNGRPALANAYLPARATYDTSADPDDSAGMYQDTSVQMLQRRGLIVLTCHTAVEEQARALAREGFAPTGMSSQEIANDILTHLIPGAFVVPSMVAAIAVLQSTYRYAYLTPL